MNRRTCGYLILASIVFFCVPDLCWAQGFYGTPLYDPESKRYFELVYARNQEWKEDMAAAQKRQYNGVQGRLAIVDSAEIHSFLLLKFHPNTETWIGMEYMCQQHALLDSTGKRLDGMTFQAWATEWKPDFYACNNGTMSRELEYMPLAYTPVGLGQAIGQGFRWTGWGVAKRFDAYFVEYPTGGP